MVTDAFIDFFGENKYILNKVGAMIELMKTEYIVQPPLGTTELPGT